MLTPRSKYWRARIAGAAALAALLVASACWIEEPAAPTPAPLTLWIAPGGFFIEDVMSEAISIQDLSARLRERLAATSNPEALNVRKYVGLSSSGYEIAKRAACEAGVRMIYYSSDLPPDGDPVQASSVGTRVEQPLTSPCTSYTPSAQVKSCIQNVEDRPWVDSIVGTPQVEPMREDWAQITGVAAVRQQGAESTRINWICDLYRDEAGEWQRRYLSFAPIE